MPTSNLTKPIGEDAIARRAHELWEQEGRPEGRAVEHWLEAERQLRGTGESQEASQAFQVMSADTSKRPNRSAVNPRNGQKNRPAMK